MKELWKVRYLFNKWINRVNIARRAVDVGKGTNIYGRLIIKGKGRISIGESCLINSSMYADPIGGDICTILRADDSATLEIGNGCGISNSAIVAQERIVIEDNVFIGGGCKIYDTDFHDLNMFRRIHEDYSEIKTKEIIIHSGVFIGAHSIVLKGVEIGENVIIGAGSVVTKSIPANEVWAGNPARRIR